MGEYANYGAGSLALESARSPDQRRGAKPDFGPGEADPMQLARRKGTRPRKGEERELRATALFGRDRLSRDTRTARRMIVLHSLARHGS